MSDFLGNLVAQVLEPPAVQPRLRSRFDPAPSLVPPEFEAQFEVEEEVVAPPNPPGLAATAPPPATPPRPSQVAMSPLPTSARPAPAAPPLAAPGDTTEAIVLQPVRQEQPGDRAPPAPPTPTVAVAPSFTPVAPLSPLVASVPLATAPRQTSAPPAKLPGATIPQTEVASRRPATPITPTIVRSEERPLQPVSAPQRSPQPRGEPEPTLEPTQTRRDDSAAPSLEEASSAPTIQVTIGRVEVRAIVPSPPPPARPAPRPHLSLDDYLRKAKGDRP
jgi:hypothetical protein